MTAIHETAYPRIRSTVTQKELNTIYTPTEKELLFVSKHTYNSVSKHGFLVLLKVFQRLGYFPSITQIPNQIIRHIAENSGLKRFLPDIRKYDKVGSRWKHKDLIRDYFAIKPFDDSGDEVMARAMHEATRSKNVIADIVNVGIEELVRKNYELPAFTTLVKTSREIRSGVFKNLYATIYNSLGSKNRKSIQRLLKKPVDDSQSLWSTLKQEPKQPTTNTMREFVKHMQWLRSINISAAILEDIPEIKRKHFADEAKTLDLYQINDMKERKRTALVACLINEQATKAINDFAEIYIKRVQSLHNRGGEALEIYRLNHQDQTDKLVVTLEKIVTAWSTEEDQLKAITDIIGTDADTIIQQCKSHMVYSNNNYIPFLPKLFKSQRKNFFDFIELLEIRSTSSDVSLEQSIDFLLENKNSKSEHLSIILNPTKKHESVKDKDLLNISWIPDKWLKHVVGKSNKGKRILQVHRKYFEICLFSCVMQDLKSGDLYIEGSDTYGDYRKQLISWEEYQKEVIAYCERVGFPNLPAEFIQSLYDKFIEKILATDRSFLKNESVFIKNGELVIRKASKKNTADGLDIIEKELSERMPKTNVIDALCDTEHWLNWTSRFKLISGNETKINSPRERYIATTFCYGCNLGPSQTARSMKGIDRKQLAYINKRHIDEDKIQDAVVDVINAYNKYWLPKMWGDGTSSSADGTKWDMYQRNLLSEYHIRYGGWGGIGYYHVSDTYIALFSNFISCGVWEAVYILDGLMKNKSEIRPDTLHADTQGQSSIVFALAYLLGIRLMPRIRGLKKLKFFKPYKDFQADNIGELFNDDINWKLIETHLPDMLRIAISISKGKITPSTILRELGTYSRKNKLYFAFRELGRVVRTQFLLDYISDEELRKTIRAATINSEEWNSFIDWVAFGGQGVINENVRDEQRKIIKYNHLVANLLIFHNVNSMTKALNDMIEEGFEVSEEILADLAPYRTENFNRFGAYDMRFDRAPEPLDDSLYSPVNLVN